jgi:hypothetical protein
MGRTAAVATTRSDSRADDLDASLARLEGAAARVLLPDGRAKVAEHTRDELSGMIARLVQIDESLAAAGATKLLEEKEDLRDQLKQAMGRQQIPRAVDETTGFAATLKPSFSKVYDPAKLRPLLKTKAQRERCIVATVDVDAVKQLVELGVFTEAQLEQAGVFTQRLRGVSLFVRPVEDTGRA